jgi:hypothetical protein
VPDQGYADVACIDELNAAPKAAPAFAAFVVCRRKNPGITGVASGEDLPLLDAPLLKRLARRADAHRSPKPARVSGLTCGAADANVTAL